jgi:hypothetical protein
VAWNGLSLRVPPQWEVSSLAVSYLQLDDEVGPVLELKWQQIKGVFSFKTHLKKLSQLSTSTPGVDFQKIPLPQDWQQALRNFEVQSFVWQSSEVSGKGAILYCSECQKAILLQFYQKQGRDDPSIPLEILHSFRDHSEDGMVPWALFGLRALIPQRFALVRHRFHPGHYQLEFQHQKEHLFLIRWGPADLLLQDDDLLAWFHERGGELNWCHAADMRACKYHGKPALQGQSQVSIASASRLWARMTKKFPHIWVRVWHLASRNQILGVAARGLMPLNEQTLEEVCSNYEMV